MSSRLRGADRPRRSPLRAVSGVRRRGGDRELLLDRVGAHGLPELGVEVTRRRGGDLDIQRAATASALGMDGIDHVPFEERNVDHVLVGPRGVIAVESKYSSGPWQILGDELRGPIGDPLGQAGEGARKIRLLLQSELVGAHVPVAAALAVWGPAQREIKGGSAVSGVWLLAGRESREWARQLPARADQLPPEAVEKILRGLRAFIHMREEAGAVGRVPAA